jgi:hypothetical protein
MSLRELGWESVDGIHLAQERAVTGFYEHDNETSGSMKWVEFFE